MDGFMAAAHSTAVDTRNCSEMGGGGVRETLCDAVVFKSCMCARPHIAYTGHGYIYK